MQNLVSHYIQREIFDEVARHLDAPEMTLITGSRQVGKSVLLEQLRSYLVREKGITPEAIFYYNLDIIQDWETVANQQAFIDFLKSRSVHQRIYVFIDEAQKIPEAARFFKGVYDSKPNAKLVLTGSASLEIKAKFKETLAGRKRVFPLAPFTFPEYVSAQDRTLAGEARKGEWRGEIDFRTIFSFYKEYLVFGGYPRVALCLDKGERQQILREIYSSYVERDAIGFLEIKQKTAFTRLIKLLASQIGQLVNIEELATHIGVDRHTVERYIQGLEETFLIRRIKPYYRNPRQEIIKAGKIYFLDSGIRNMALENFSLFDERADKGTLLENAVMAELSFLTRSRPQSLHFWRTKQASEIDFIIENGLTLLPIEVKTVVKQNRIPAGLRNFIEKFNPKDALLTNLSVNNTDRAWNHTLIHFFYPFEMRRWISRFNTNS